MKILVISRWGEAADTALRMKLEGNEIRLWIKDPEYNRFIYEGMIDKVKDWKLSVSWAELIYFDSNPLDDIWKQVHKLKPCYQGSEFAELLEHDREYAHKLMKTLKINGPESKTYDKIQEVYKHLKEHKVPHVVKPFGPKVQSEHIIIGQYPDNSDSIGLLERFEGEKIPVEGIEVEEKIEGIEVGYSAWFNGKDWVYPINVNFQHKPFADGDRGNGLGYLTGEMGTVMTYLEDRDNKFFKACLDPIKPILKENNYRGQIDIGLIVTKEGKPYALEYTPRNGTPSQYIEYRLHKTPITDLVEGVTKGTMKQFEVSKDWSIGVVVVTPGYPDNKEVKKKSAGTPIFKVGKDNAAEIHFYEAKKKEGKFYTSEGMGYPLVATSTGKDIESCRGSVYDILDKKTGVYIPNSWYRNDIGQRVIKQMPLIKDLGIL